MYGDLGGVNMWNFEMTADDIAQVSMETRGNIVNKDTIQMEGSPTTIEMSITSFQKFGVYRI